MQLADRSAARRLVQSIANDHGYLDEGVYSQMTPDVRRRVEEALMKKDKMIGSSVVTYVHLLLPRLHGFEATFDKALMIDPFFQPRQKPLQ